MMKQNRRQTRKSFIPNHKNKWLFVVVTSVVLVFHISYKPTKRTANATPSDEPLTLPETSDWVNQGIAISQGADGEWDRYLGGGFANSLIKKDGVYYLYYQGSPSFDNDCGDNAHRAIGLATSTDGIHWTKHPENPIITWTDQGAPTEGAASSGAIIGNDGDIYIYYGAKSGSVCFVSSAGRLAHSSDGIHFTDQGQVIPNATPLWGYGDEIFPVGGFLDGSIWYVYYIPNGVAQMKKLGVISGTDPMSFDPQSSTGVNNGTLSAWGPLSVIADTFTAYAFVNDPANDKPVKAYSFSPSVPNTMTLSETYVFSDCWQASVLYDVENSRWLMLCREKVSSQYYLVKTAPNIPPNPPKRFIFLPTVSWP